MQERSKEDLINAFHMMWDHYPEQVRLIDREFLVVAGNPAYLAAGGQVDVHCNIGDPELHRGCGALAALNSRKTMIKKSEVEGMHWETYWIPVAGETDYYVHFTNGLNAFIEHWKSKKQS